METRVTKQSRQYYLQDVPLDQATRDFQAALDKIGFLRLRDSKTIPIDQALGYLTYEPVWAKISSPYVDSAAMDGISVRAEDTIGASETHPIFLKIGEQASWIDTGDPIPAKHDAVIMVEVVHVVDDETVEIRSPVPPYHHVRSLGEDIAATQLLLPPGHKLRPVDLAACAASGFSEINVRRPPRVIIIPTGSELVPVGSTMNPGDIIESNGMMLASMISEWGGNSTIHPVISDDPEKLKSALQQAVKKADIVIINAGSSAGIEDYTSTAVSELGQLVIHGVAVRPGHPVVLGIVGGKPIFGIPGYPVSAALTSELFIKPIIEKVLGLPPLLRDKIKATITRKIVSPMGEDEFVRVTLGKIDGKIVATPLQRGAGVIMSLVKADGLASIPRFSEGVDVGTEIEVDLLRPLKKIENTIVVTGSHDLTLDLLASRLSNIRHRVSLSSSNVGSLGGLMALARGEAHIAGSHLLDAKSGEYNLSFIRKYLKNKDIVVVNLVKREQGLIVAKGNPSNLSSLNDLRRHNIKFVNRQRGSGTRVLLDYKLNELDIEPATIRGYEREEYTHLAIAAAIEGGIADVGLGIFAAAKAMKLDFIPLLLEEYDLIIPSVFYNSPLLSPLFDLIRNEEFKNEVNLLGGYDTSNMGKIIAKLNRTEN